jgi:hypothetical protein
MLNRCAGEAREKRPDFPDLRFSCRFDYACSYFHSGVRTAEGRSYKSLASLLRTEHPRDAIVDSPFRRMTELKLVEKLLTDDAWAGLVTIRGGRETRIDAASAVQGFCLGKHRTEDVRELGDFAVRVNGRAEGAEDRLRDQCKKRNLTMAKRSFDGLNTLSTQHLRFLVQHRGLRGFRLVHYTHLSLRDFIFPYIFRLLRERHLLKRRGGNPLLGLSLKLQINACYGYSFVESTSFAKCLIQTLRNLRKRKSAGRDPNVISCTLMGLRGGGGASGSRREDASRNLLYCITRHKPRARIHNLAHVAAQVLCTSRYIFYSHLLFLISCANPALLTPVYMVSGWRSFPPPPH